MSEPPEDLVKVTPGAVYTRTEIVNGTGWARDARFLAL